MAGFIISKFKTLNQILVQNRFMISVGFSLATGIVLRSLFPTVIHDPILRYAALNRPALYQGFLFSYNLFLFTTPFLFLSLLFSFSYIHFYRYEIEAAIGPLPPYPDPRYRKEIFLVLGEMHEPIVPKPSRSPRWLTIPERGLYTGIASIGSIGSGKTQGFILPAMRQLFGYKAFDSERRLSGIVLEVKGDLCDHLAGILKEHDREEDYIEVSLASHIRYNPLNNDLDAYAQAFNIASIITSIWGKGKEPFWQQSYTDLVRYVIVLRRLAEGYVTLVDVFRSVISSRQLEELLAETGSRLSATAHIAISKESYSAYRQKLARFGFVLDPGSDSS